MKGKSLMVQGNFVANNIVVNLGMNFIQSLKMIAIL